jgi:hypothetical protein
MVALVVESGVTPACALHDLVLELTATTAVQLLIKRFKALHNYRFLVKKISSKLKKYAKILSIQIFVVPLRVQNYANSTT